MMFKDSTPPYRFFMSLFIVVVSFLIVFISGSIIAIPLFGENIFTNPNIVTPGVVDNINVSKYFQALTSIGIFLVPPIIIAFLFSSEKSGYLGLKKSAYFASYVLVAFAAFAILPLIEFTAYINSGMNLPDSLSGLENWLVEKEQLATDLTLIFLKMDSVGDLVVNMVLMAILPAIGEELLFRGVFQRIFIEWTRNIHVGVFITAILFSAVHFQFYTFLPRFVLGLFLGYLFVWSKSIWLPVLAHFLNNAIAVLVYYLSSDESKEDILSTSEMTFSIPIVIGTLLIFIFLGRLIYRIERNLVKI